MASLDDDEKSAIRIAISSSRGKLAYGGDRMFLGSVDDSVSRYPWVGFAPELGFLNKRLVDGVLFGAPICVRMGNILYQDEYLKALVEPSTSQLLELAKVGFIQLQTRANSINESIAARIATGTKSALTFQSKHNWSQGSELYERLERIDNALDGTDGKLQYDGEFSDLFRAIMLDSQNGGTAEFREVFEAWSKRPDDGANRTRNNFEQDAAAVFPNDPVKRRKAMWVANAANHYAYAMQMAKTDGSGSGRMPMVETTQFDRHAEICADRQPIPTEIADEILAKRNQDDPVNAALAVIRIPKAAYEPAMAPRLAKLAHFQSCSDTDADDRTRQRFLAAKTTLVAVINSYLQDPSRFSKKSIIEPAKEYQEALYEALGTRDETHFRVWCRFTLHETVSTIPDEAGKGAVALAAGAALGGGVLGAAVGLVVGVGLSSVDLRLIDRAKRLLSKPSDLDTPLDVVAEGDAGTAREQLGKRAGESLRFGSYVGVRTLAMDKTRTLKRRLALN